MLGRLKRILYEKKKKSLWRANNTHNFTNLVSCDSLLNCIEVGKATYGGLNVLCFESTKKLKIGNYCSIGPEVLFVLSGDHNLNYISTYPFKVKIRGDAREAGPSKGNIIVEDDVWIGARAIICAGVHIGQGAVIAAGAVVTKDVEPYAIYGGVPARLIRYRFEEKAREQLCRLDYSSINNEKIINNIDFFYEEVNLENAQRLVDAINGRE